MEALRFDDLALRQVAFEARYNDALLLWDHSGRIWSQLVLARPELKPSHVEPSKVIFETKTDHEVQLTLEPKRLIVIAVRPDKKLLEFSKLVDQFAEIAADATAISTYTRLGLRVSFWKEYADRESAAEALLTTGSLNIPEGPHFGLSAPIVDPEIAIRREDGKHGFLLRLKAETVTFDFQVPFGLAHFAKREPITIHRVHLDVDCYTQAPVERSQLYISDWIDQTLHVMKRDSQKFFGE